MRDATELLRALGDPKARTLAFCIFHARRIDAVRTQLWCDSSIRMLTKKVIAIRSILQIRIFNGAKRWKALWTTCGPGSVEMRSERGVRSTVETSVVGREP